MKLKIIVQDQDFTRQKLLQVHLEGLGHEVHLSGDAFRCPLWQDHLDPVFVCNRSRACAEVMILDRYSAKIDTLELFKLQRSRGCKLLDGNKAIIGSCLVAEDLQALSAFGFHFLRRPFRLKDLENWVEGCQVRLKQAVIVA